jgi:tetratricopeptide (TPR) repeat protein
MSRIDALKGFLEQDPNDSFSRYALAMEYVKLGRLKAGIEEFETIVQTDPSCVPTYYQLGKAYERGGQLESAIETYRKGVEAASMAGDPHTRDELSEALAACEGAL